MIIEDDELLLCSLELFKQVISKVNPSYTFAIILHPAVVDEMIKNE